MVNFVAYWIITIPYAVKTFLVLAPDAQGEISAFQ